ncbi:GNAT family N-acetyltransferase [Simkania sp.]|uniref:GNAT family N-acetyltransferase n=1 Tax=Simkania sp. TaxID=34094 RepID=UPI003B51C179
MRTIYLSHFDLTWKDQAIKEMEKIHQAFDAFPLMLHHIGSTSIPSCQAKPIIDLLGVVSDVTLLDPYQDQLEQLGYESLGEFGMRRRRYFVRETSPAVHLHIFEDTDPEVDRHLRFRDYLRNHPEEIKAYSDLKRELVTCYPNDRQRYTLEKTPFIKRIDRLAALESSPSIRKWGSKRKSWTEDQIQDAMEANMLLPMTLFAKYVTTQEIVFEPDVTVVRAEIQDDTYNYVVDAKFELKSAPARIQAVLAHYQEKNLPFSWWVGESDSPKDLAQHLLAAGLKQKEDDIGMFMPLTKPIPTQNSLKIQRIEDRLKLKDFANIFIALSGYQTIYEEYYQLIPPILYQGQTPLRFYVGYEGNTPVTTGILILHANVAGIYYIMTHPSHRRKGYGTAMMHHLLNCAKQEGFYLATLQASEEGKNLYERMGFQPSCRFVEYSL